MKKLIFYLLCAVPILGFGQTKISDMPAATTPTGTELVPIVQSGVNKKATINQINSGYIKTADFYTIGDSRWLKLPSLPGISQDGQSLRWNNGTGLWEYFTPGSSGSYLPLTLSANTDITSSTYYTSFKSTNDEIQLHPSSSRIHFINTSMGGYTGSIYGNGVTSSGNYDYTVGGDMTFTANSGAGGFTFNGTISNPQINGAKLETSSTAGHVWTASGTDGSGGWAAPSGGGGTWGSITGTLSDQTDLQSALDAKLNLTGATYTTTTGNGLDLTSSTVTSGNLVSITNTGTAAASDTKTALFVGSSGANGTSGETTRAAYFSNTNTGTSSTNYGLFATATGGTTNWAIGTSGDVDIGGALFMNNNQVFTLSGSTQINLTPTTLVTNGNFILRSASTNAVTIGNRSSAGAVGALILQHTNNQANTSGTNNALISQGGFVPASGTGIWNGVRVANLINQTGGANGQITSFLNDITITASVDVTGFKHDPVTPGNISGTHLSFHATSGKVLFGGTSITANTSYDFRGVGTGSDRILRIANSSNSELANYRETGEYYHHTGSTGTYKEKHYGGTSSGTSISETVYSSTEIADGEAVTIEVLWVAKDLDSNTSAGGIMYATWSKDSGTLVKAGDDMVSTNNNTTDTFTVSSTDSSGNIQVTISSTGSSGNWKGNAFVKSIVKH